MPAAFSVCPAVAHSLREFELYATSVPIVWATMLADPNESKIGRNEAIFVAARFYAKQRGGAYEVRMTALRPTWDSLRRIPIEMRLQLTTPGL